MRSIEAFLAVALLVAILVGFAAADGDESSTYILNPESREDLIAFVNEARDFVLEEGMDKALQVFNDPAGEFVRGDHYIIAYDFNGTRLAHPYKPGPLGENALNATDSNGVAIIRTLLGIAKRGEGFSYYVWPNPAHSGAEELKLTYVLKVDEELWLGSGIYLTGPTPVLSNETREDLIAFVERAKDYALNNSKDASLKAFNDINGEFVEGDRYIFAYDFDGNTLALSFQPELIGTNRLESYDPNGNYWIKDQIEIAKTGSGFTYYIYPDPVRNMTPKLKLSFVTKVDDKWFLGSGIYWPDG